MMTTQLIKRLFIVKEYHHMIEAGILTKDHKVELIRGEIVQMAAVGRRHTSHVNRLTELFYTRLLSRVTIGVQDPVELDDYSEPEPDISLLRRRDDFYESGHPQSEDILLIVEVADATAETDRNIKIPLYAENNIVKVWLVDIKEPCVVVYREPSPSGYQNIHRFQRGQTLSILAFPDIQIVVDNVLG